MNRRGFMGMMASVPLVDRWLGDWLAEADARESGVLAGPSVLDRIRQDPAEVMRLSGMEPDPWQQQALRSKAKRSLLLCSRQTGKSQTAAAIALATSLCYEPKNNPGGLVLIVSPSLRQSVEMHRTIRWMRSMIVNFGTPTSAWDRKAKRIGRWQPRHLTESDIIGSMEPGLEVAAENVLSTEFANGNRIIALPGSVSGKATTVVGPSAVLLLIYEEAARIRDEYYSSLTPTLAVTEAKHGVPGRTVALSTPYGKQGWFWEACNRCFQATKVWDGFKAGRGLRELAASSGLTVPACEQIVKARGDPGWEMYKNTWRDCPRITEDFVAEERASLLDRWFRQEYEVSFEETSDAVFNTADIDALVRPAQTPKRRF